MTTRYAVSAAGTVVVLTTLGIVAADRWPASLDADMPTARVTRGTLALDVQISGVLRAKRSVPMTTPRAGVSLPLVVLAGTGATVKQGDIVMEFDPAEQAHALEQSRSELEEAEQEIVKLQADADVRQAEDDVELLTARFDVRRAELQAVADLNLIGVNEAKRRALTLEEAQRRLEELEGALSSRDAINRASLAVLEERRTQARLASRQAQQIIDNLVVRAPFDGVVVVRENRDGVTLFFSGMTLPEYRVGDMVRPGRVVAEIVEVGQLQIVAKVDELESPNLKAGQTAVVRVDGLPDHTLAATVEAVAGMVSRDGFFNASGPVREFDVFLQLDTLDPRLRPGMSVQVTVAGRSLSDALLLPRHAIFETEGEPVVYVSEDGVFAAQPVTVVGRSEDFVAIEGVAEGTEVALLDPTARDRADPPNQPTPAGAAQ
ncbi:MAG: HlyD family efflux transporter periplasmic adaptor subunit [Acidobacteria bacterium]|nr:HlyD family efflux transporter periplasmic adaptor subunit [Acidobacteriota bacterium]